MSSEPNEPPPVAPKPNKSSYVHLSGYRGVQSYKPVAFNLKQEDDQHEMPPPPPPPMIDPDSPSVPKTPPPLPSHPPPSRGMLPPTSRSGNSLEASNNNNNNDDPSAPPKGLPQPQFQSYTFSAPKSTLDGPTRPPPPPPPSSSYTSPAPPAQQSSLPARSQSPVPTSDYSAHKSANTIRKVSLSPAQNPPPTQAAGSSPRSSPNPIRKMPLYPGRDHSPSAAAGVSPHSSPIATRKVPAGRDLLTKLKEFSSNESLDRLSDRRGSNDSLTRKMTGSNDSLDRLHPGDAKAARAAIRNAESELDSLSRLLTTNLTKAEGEMIGACARCGQSVLAEQMSCQALGKLFHTSCFDCFKCHRTLKNVAFYNVHEEPLCQDCYQNTLDKCAICAKPILQRLIRATGRPFHPECFSCVLCSKNLADIPFTVDSQNQIHCIDCFQEKFAPRCSVCSKAIVPPAGQKEARRIVALERSFHVDCYRCEDCNVLLTDDSQGCYPLDDHIYCRGCNTKRIQKMTAARITTSL